MEQAIEQAVEHASSLSYRLKALIAPNILYVGVTTLTSSFLVRNCGLAFHLLPHTLPTLSLCLPPPNQTQHRRKYNVAKVHSTMTVDHVQDVMQSGHEAGTAGVPGAVTRLDRPQRGQSPPRYLKRREPIIFPDEGDIHAWLALFTKKI
ncbi:hypothetical protein B0H21DRAFT_826008 [Amylocystis lapponica]|nr:hypothetical protein B0H21DRAFT_826008 [Amylocystis lapponica]